MVKVFQEAARVKVFGDDLAEMREAQKDEEGKFFAKSPIYRDKMCLDEARFAFDAMALPTCEDVVAEEEAEEPLEP